MITDSPTSTPELYTLAGTVPDTRDAMLAAGLTRISEATPTLARLRGHWRNEQPAAFLSKKASDALDNRLRRLGTNFPRLAVNSLADRMKLSGIARPDKRRADLWPALLAARLRSVAGQVHTDRLLYGTAYLTVWATETGTLTLTADSPWTMAHSTDPATGETLYAVRVWETPSGSRAVLYEPSRITHYATSSPGAALSGAKWEREREQDNPLDAVPVVPFVRRESSADPWTGASAVSDILDLTDAVAKLLADAMVTSEYYARPRRWATGLELEEDEDGNVLDPFGESRLLQSEAPETKFGQFAQATLTGYGELVATMTQQIGSLTGLPPHYLGLHGDQPASADGVKAAEAQLTERAYDEMDELDAPWQTVAWLAAAITAPTPGPAVEGDRAGWATSWKSPEIRTQAQAADAAAKLHGMGVPLRALLVDPLGYAPDTAAELASAATAPETAETPPAE